MGPTGNPAWCRVNPQKHHNRVQIRKFRSISLSNAPVEENLIIPQPLTFPDKVIVLHKLAKRPTAASDHVKLDALIISKNHQRVAAKCMEDNVIYDYRTSKKTHLEPDMVEVLSQTWDLQERERSLCNQQILKILATVDELEQNAGFGTELV